MGVFVSMGSLALGCGGGGPLERPSDTAVQASAVGTNRCTAEGDEQRLFVVDWDATDLAAFESRAGRDVVFVKYDECKVTILHGCSDDGIAGRYGAYDKAIATSGTVESLVVKDTSADAERQALRQQQLLRVRQLLTLNEKAITELERVSAALGVVAFGEDAAFDGFAGAVGFVLDAGVNVVHAPQEQEIRYLLHDFHGVGDAAGPEGIPD